MRPQDVNMTNIKELTPEELAALKRQGYKNIAGFVLFKVALYTTIALIARKLRKSIEKKDM